MKKIKTCEICGSKKLKPFRDLGRIGKPGEYGKLKICICYNCGHRFLNPRKSDKYFRDYYKKQYRKVAFGSFKPSKYYISEQYKRSLGVLNFFNNKLIMGNFLDHGCASGATMIPWKERGWNVYGIDPHLPSVLVGKKEFSINIEHAFGESLPNKNDFFMTVMSLGSLEHSYDVNKSLEEIYRVMKENGQLIIRWRTDKISGSPYEYYNHNHFRYFTRQTWNLILSKHGFKILKYIDKKLEKYNTYEYILAKKIKSKTKKIKCSTKLAKKLITENLKQENNYSNFYKEYSKHKKMNIKKLNVIIKKFKKKNINNYKKVSYNRMILELKSYKKIKNNLHNESR
tara:strand:- start:104 stop:1129 length:1026 start_codon:yes stop_codon:yes gene_type:complete